MDASFVFFRKKFFDLLSLCMGPSSRKVKFFLLHVIKDDAKIPHIRILAVCKNRCGKPTFRSIQMPVAKKIADIIKKRAESTKPLMQYREKCDAVLKCLNSLEHTMNSFVENKNIDEKGVYPCQQCLEQFPLIKRKVGELQNMITKSNMRFGRSTINIGFGGKKGTGKSFLLQKLSGLTSNEVPSAKGLPVTAVSSKIFNSLKSRAIITFYDERSFLQEIIVPYCEKLSIPAPDSIENFANMTINLKNEINTHYYERLIAFQKHIDEYKSYLTGKTEEIELNKIRKFVAYTDENSDDIFTYLAVKDATIYTVFPETNVRQLGLIDLPGLGELNPTVEKKHTTGFEDDVDLVMLIRRPSSERVDWDQSDFNALQVLQKNSPVENFSNFIVFVHNEGGCDDAMAEKSMQSMIASLPDNFTILRTKGQNTETLSQDVLDKVLSHLALKLPEMDKQTLDIIYQKSQNIWKDIATFSQNAHEALKASNDGGYKEEIYIQQARDSMDKFSDGCMEALDALEAEIQKNGEDQELLDSLSNIQENIDAYFENGLDRKTSKEDWIKKAVRNIATKGSSGPVFNETANTIRVKIAEEFTALDHIYKLKVDELLFSVANQFDKVLPGFLPNGNAREKLTYLKKRIEDADTISINTIYEAIDALLNLKIEHRTQFYPRVYEPIRDFRTYVSRNPTIANDNELDRQQKADAIFETLKDLSDRTIMQMMDLLKIETTRIKDILFVSLEHFIDKMGRSEHAETQWVRLIRTFYGEIWGGSGNAAASLAISDIMKQLRDLKTICVA